MSKKNFIALADAIREHNAMKRGSFWAFTDDQLETLSLFCAGQNRNFNASRWLSYIKGECGPNGGEIRRAKITSGEIASHKPVRGCL